jgi:hypothetical protein
MLKTRWFAAGCVAALLLLAPRAQAQRTPYIGYIYPAGGQQGSSFQGFLSGQYLDGATNVIVSGEGVEAVILNHVKPLNGRQLTLLRDRMRELQKGLAAAPKNSQTISFQNPYNTNVLEKLERDDAEKELAGIRRQLANPKNRRPPNPQLAEDVTLKVTLAANAKPGRRELRLMTANGLSNPVAFYVGDLNEYIEVEPKSNPTELGNTVALPVVINGQILPGDVDRFRFRGRRGQKLVVAVSARQLIPYIADAVPGWFQATVGLYDARGKELRYADDFRFNPDPVLYYEIPADGEYVIEIKDSIYRGREDFVYRITVGELPFITSIFPLGGPAGQKTSVALKGWNLPQPTVELSPAITGLELVQIKQEKFTSNPMPFAADDLPEQSEAEPNNGPRTATPATLPVIFNGRINQPGDWDVFSFTGKAGETMVAEVMARRLNSPLDSILRLADAAGNQVALNDDCEDKGAGLSTHHADSYLMATLPADGTYYLHLGDSQNQGGPDFAYRLRLSAPRPDFELRLVPASLNPRGGGSAPVTVHALRKDGFTNEIKLALKDPPKGFALSGGRVPAGTNVARLNLTAPPLPPEKPVTLVVEGRATIAGQEVVRTAVPAEDMMQAFYYRHLVPAQDLTVAVLGRGKAANAPPKGLLPKGGKKNPPAPANSDKK